jgi:hypothetical protein
MDIRRFPVAENPKRWLVEQLEFTASWRELEADRCCCDGGRNARCAKSLRRIAATVKDLPAGHELFRKLAQIDFLTDSIRAGWLEEVSELISRIGLTSPCTDWAVIQRLVGLTDARLLPWRERRRDFH